MIKMTRSEAGRLGGVASGRVSKLKHQEYVENYYKCPKRCPYCNKVISYEKRKNKFCSQSCATSYNNHLRNNSLDRISKEKNGKKKTSVCLNCGKEFKTRNSFGKYCSNKCQADYQAKERIGLWKEGKISGLRGNLVATWLKNYLLEKVKHRCERCGWDKINPYTGKSPLEVHHIDGNYLNNKEENLQVLCPNCHALTGNYKNLNKNNGRKSRKPKLSKD